MNEIAWSSLIQAIKSRMFLQMFNTYFEVLAVQQVTDEDYLQE